ncbi:uncharacterized protein DUF4249 [Arcicella aurantiaca]|uniref:Uncharacterized protein DUF4249 n=1 Tax=Arcicella aurantiaca TaxID=591202 RepID=A0A316DZ95_9BACT|nr:DUF4249 domain-containing protein [Arcicella aurantiaca]PWK21863.1 uncharacterized protein DUF4249 [Arcicella aurantiaca]
MKTLKYLFFIASTCTMLSCQTVVENINLPYEERLVIESFISPQDTLLEVKVSKTKPVVGTFPSNQYSPYSGNEVRPIIEGAIVEISDGQKKATFQLQTIVNPFGTEYDPSTGKPIPQSRRGYFLKTKDFPIVAGKTYTLTAKAPNLPEVSATCTVPNKQLINGNDFTILKGSTIDSIQNGYSSTDGVITNRYYNLSRRFDVTAKDLVSEENYYAIAYYTHKGYKYNDGKGGFITQTITEQQPYSDFISDYKQDGKTLNFKKANISLGYYSTDSNNPNPQNTQVLSHNLSIYLAITDKAYYQYNKGLINSQGINNDDPFSEAVLTYSNVKGGLGVFSGYNMTKIEFDLLK